MRWGAQNIFHVRLRRFANQNQFMTFHVFWTSRSQRVQRLVGSQFYGLRIVSQMMSFCFPPASNPTISNFLQPALNGTQALNWIHKYLTFLSGITKNYKNQPRISNRTVFKCELWCYKWGIMLLIFWKFQAKSFICKKSQQNVCLWYLQPWILYFIFHKVILLRFQFKYLQV